MNPGRRALRDRRDAAIAHFAGAMILGAASLLSIGIAPWRWVGVLQVLLFVVCFVYAMIAWFKAAFAHIELRRIPAHTGPAIAVAPTRDADAGTGGTDEGA